MTEPLTQEFPNTCPMYRYKPEEDKVTSCDGTLVITIGHAYYTCKDCGKEIPLSVEM